MAAHGGVDGERSHGGEGTDNTRGPTDGAWATGGGDPGGTEQTESRGETEDPEGLGGAECSGDWGEDRDPEDRVWRRMKVWSPEAADGRRLTKAELEGPRWS